MRVLLVSHSFEDSSRTIYVPNTAYSLGLAYLSANLEKLGHTVSVAWMDNFDFAYAHKSILDKISEFKPDVLGIQMFSMNRVSSFKLIDECAALYPGIRIVVGGIHASALPEQIAGRYKNVIVIAGEGEDTFGEFLDNLKEGPGDLSKVAGLAFFKDGRVVRTSDRALIADLDRLPYPKHDIFFDMEPKRTAAHIITSRGCSFQCSFCCLHLISKRRVRFRKVEAVAAELLYLKTKYPRLNYVQIHDDNFTLDNARVIEFCKAVIKMNLGIKFSASARIKPVSDEMLDYMEKAGFEKLMFGLETGSEKLMLDIHKGIRKSDVIELFKKLKKHSFVVQTFIMSGFPGESKETIKETIGFVKMLQKIKYSFIFCIAKLWVYPGTEVYEIMKKKNQISDDYWLTSKDVPFFTSEHDLATLKRYENELYDNLSIVRIFTLRGFMRHFLSMPLTIISFIFKNPYLFKLILSETLKYYSPSAHRRLYGMYRRYILKDPVYLCGCN